ncbi:MAG: Spo0E family sporulation regulatory protein-aspartic acid phosphatase [Clostridiales bacterium]
MNHLETIREKLHKSMEVDKKDSTLKISQELDKLILEYLKNNISKRTFS